MKQGLFGAVVACVVAFGVAGVNAQAKDGAKKASAASASLGSVKISRNVTADGQALAAGTYMLKVSDEMPKPVVGQPTDQTRWVEFSQGGKVKGREIATVLTKDDLKAMEKNGGGPAAGSAKVQLLKGDDYVRVWINHGGTNYLIHLSVAK